MGMQKSYKKVSVGSMKEILKDLLENARLPRSRKKQIEEILSIEDERTFNALINKYNIEITINEDEEDGKKIYMVVFGVDNGKGYMKKEGEDTWSDFFTLSSDGEKRITEYQIKKNYIRPERIDFDSVFEKLGKLQFELIRIIKSISRKVDVTITTEWITKNILAICLKEPDDSVYAIYVHVSQRKWYCPRSKAEIHVRALINASKRFERQKHLKVKARTYVLIANYTKGVKGRGLARRGFKKAKDGYFFFRPDKAWLETLVRSVYNMFKSRLVNLQRALEREQIKPFGVVKDLLFFFKECVEIMRVVFGDILFNVNPNKMRC